MKKIFITIFIISSSIFSFSAKPMQNKKLDVELKTMLRTGFNPLSKSIALLGEVAAYKAYRFEKPDVMVNVGGGIDVGASIRNENTKYFGLVRPYFATEIGGYVSPDVRVYGDIKLGLGILFTDKTASLFHKAGASIGVTYKKFTFELGYDLPTAISIGFGARFGF